MLDLYQLQQLLTVAECGTLSAAAQRLHLSQPALSRSMQRLEAELQVPLFLRQKNKLALNDNGRLAVEYARKLIEQSREMADRIQALDRSRRTISVGSCAPAPLWEIPPLLCELYPERTVSSELRENEALLQGLKDGAYQLIILPYPVQQAGIFCTRYREEHLFFSLPPAHPLAKRSTLRLADLNGETMLLRNHLGFWNQTTGEMPDARFLVQEDFAFDELVKASDLPCFTSDLAIQRDGSIPSRVTIPIEDEIANVTYYCLCKSADQSALKRIFRAFSAR